MDAVVVIPVLNQARYTRACLEDLRESGIPESQIVVVNNGSTDETESLLGSRPGLQVIHNPANRGCGGAWNQGVRACPATWTVLLNNDVLLPPGWLEALVAFAEEERFDVVSPAICHGPDDYDFAAYAPRFMERMAKVKRRGTASGVCFMVRRQVFEKTGLFDEDMRIGGYEDDEFFRRARQYGFPIATTGRSFLHHFGSVTQKAIKAGLNQPKASLGDREYYRAKYRLTWLKRHRGRISEKVLTTGWRLRERMQYGCTLVSYRENGSFVWR
jgi:GT2 family glycosyltransferase